MPCAGEQVENKKRPCAHAAYVSVGETVPFYKNRKDPRERDGVLATFLSHSPTPKAPLSCMY